MFDIGPLVQGNKILDVFISHMRFAVIVLLKPPSDATNVFSFVQFVNQH